MHRPEGWDNPHIWVDEGGFDVYGEHYDAYEAGADAYAEGLKKEEESELIDNRDGINGQTLWKTVPSGKRGYLVFIPED